MTTKTTRGISRRGFASMSAEQRSRIASMGGQAAHQAATAHRFTGSEAQAAGRKGGLAKSSKRVQTIAKEQ